MTSIEKCHVRPTLAHVPTADRQLQMDDAMTNPDWQHAIPVTPAPEEGAWNPDKDERDPHSAEAHAFFTHHEGSEDICPRRLCISCRGVDEDVSRKRIEGARAGQDSPPLSYRRRCTDTALRGSTCSCCSCERSTADTNGAQVSVRGFSETMEEA